MNANKAQEYFSLYFEGELEGGLREQFERTLRQDAQVQAEYKAFVRTMEQLEALKEPIAQPSFDLTEEISRRLDRHFYELERKPSTGLWTMWRKAAVAAIAVLAVVGAVASIWNANRGPSQAGGVSIPGSTPPKAAPVKRSSFDASKFDLKIVEDAWTLSAVVDSPQTLRIRSSDSSNEKTVDLGANDELSSKLVNRSADALLIELESSIVQNPIWIALPGSEMKNLVSAGKGVIHDFARAVCARKNVPVVVVARSAGEAVEWNFEGEVETAAIRAVVEKYGYAVEQKENGAIWIL